MSGGRWPANPALALMLATAVALVIGGPGVLSLDYWLARRRP